MTLPAMVFGKKSTTARAYSSQTASKPVPMRTKQKYLPGSRDGCKKPGGVSIPSIQFLDSVGTQKRIGKQVRSKRALKRSESTPKTGKQLPSSAANIAIMALSLPPSSKCKITCNRSFVNAFLVKKHYIIHHGKGSAKAIDNVDYIVAYVGILAAATFGLGAQWYSAVQTPYSSCLIKEYLGVPPEFDMYDMMVLGYPAIRPTKKFLRKFAEIVHWGIGNKGKFRQDEDTRDFVKRARAWVTGMHAKKVQS